MNYSLWLRGSQNSQNVSQHEKLNKLARKHSLKEKKWKASCLEQERRVPVGDLAQKLQGCLCRIKSNLNTRYYPSPKTRHKSRHQKCKRVLYYNPENLFLSFGGWRNWTGKLQDRTDDNTTHTTTHLGRTQATSLIILKLFFIRDPSLWIISGIFLSSSISSVYILKSSCICKLSKKNFNPPYFCE